MKTPKRWNWKMVVALAAALWMGPGPVAGLAAESAVQLQTATAATRAEAKAKAIEQAVIAGYRQIAQSLGLTPDAAVEGEVVKNGATWVEESRIVSTGEGGNEVQVRVQLDEPGLRAFVARRQGAGAGSDRPVAKELGDRLGRPNLVIALAPRLLGGNLSTADLAEQRTVLFEQMNQALGQAFFRAGFRVVEPDWKSVELEQFRASTTGREAEGGGVAGDGTITLKRNVRYRAAMDMNVDYALVGSLNVSARNTGDTVTLTLSVAGDILTTFTENDEAVPLSFNAVLTASDLAGAMQLAPAEVGHRLANEAAIPQLLQHWRDRVAEGTVFRLYIFHDDQAFLDGVVDFLDAQQNGTLFPMEHRDTNLKAVRYLTKVLRRADLSDDALLRRALGRAKGALPAGCQVRTIQGEIYFAPKTKRYDTVLAGIGQGARYLLMEYKARAYGGAGTGEASPQPVRPSSDPTPSAPPVVVRSADEPLEIGMQRAVARVAQSVGLVLVGGKGFGTAWAVRERVWASNRHIAEPIADSLKKGIPVIIRPNLSSNRNLKVTRAVWYEQYWAGESEMDVGLLFTEEATTNLVGIASGEQLLGLSQGEPVALLGFPQDSLPNGNVDLDSPIATMQTGIVAAMSDLKLSNVQPERRVLIRHNLAATGGASGSPLINRFGEVVGIHYAGPVLQITLGADNVKRNVTQWVGINYALRADLVRSLLEKAGAR